MPDTFEVHSSNLSRKVISLLTDATVIFLLVLLVRLLSATRLSSSLNSLALLTLLFTPMAIYVQTRLWGRSIGHWLTGLRRIHQATGKRPLRIYDYILDSTTQVRPEDSLPLPVEVLAAGSLLILAGGLLFFSAARDPLLRSMRVTSLPMFAPGSGDPNWRVMPWFYATGAWPIQFRSDPVLYSLPYEKGPPHRFVGKIQSYWGKTGARVTLVGPLTIRGAGSRARLRSCFTRMFACTSIRREVFDRPLAPFTQQVKSFQSQWIRVENPLLNEEERPEGLHLTGTTKTGETVEAYFLLNPLMRFQGFILQYFEPGEGEEASRILRQAIGSFRMNSEIEASRAWVNQSLSKMDIRRQAGEAKLLDAQGLLLSKISVDPASFDPFYFLAGTSTLIYRNAVERKDLEAAAAARSMVNSAYRFAQDVAPEDARMKEMETFKARVDRL